MTHQAILVEEIGKPMVLGSRQTPQPQPGQFLVRVQSTMLLPHDTYGRDGGLFFGDRLPFVIGTNISGIIESLGPNTASFQVGDRVFGLGNPASLTPEFSGLQEYALLEAEACAKIPNGFSFDQAATFPVNVITSIGALFHPLGFGFSAPFHESDKTDEKDTSILIIGGGSNVGKYGATHVVDRHASEFEIASQIQSIVGEDGLDKIYDCVSWDHTFPIGLLSTKTPGALLVLHPSQEAEKFVKEKGLDVRVQFIVGTSEFLQPLTKQVWECLPGWIEEGKLAVANYKTIEGFNLKVIEEGLDSYRDGKPVTPVVVHPWGEV
ncbi:chaperonin 10-like protein [Leptodontidium sp. 2 PMI_412]|nr:chaperonin 10-like protein [Leptodontidium sp. 2 PMI_412]